MKELYKELLEREKYLKGLKQTDYVVGRLNECILTIVRVQQSILPVVTQQIEQLKYNQECYKTGKECKYNCERLCKDSC